MQKYLIPKLIGLVILTMIILVAISFLEVAIYSYVINPGQDIKVYDAHAELTAPYVSAIFGFLAFFFTARYWKKKNFPNAAKLAIYFPLAYLIFDIVIITVAAVSWSEFFLIFAIANASKILGSLLGYKLNS